MLSLNQVSFKSILSSFKHSIKKKKKKPTLNHTEDVGSKWTVTLNEIQQKQNN